MFDPKPTLSLWGRPSWGQTVWGWTDIVPNCRITGVLFFTASTEDSNSWRDGGIEGVLSIEGEV